jgi:pyruvate,water dikinase
MKKAYLNAKQNTTYELLGNKSKFLTDLKTAGFLVPSFVVISVYSCTQAALEEVVERDLPTVTLFAVRSSAEGEDSEGQSLAGHFYSALGVQKQDLEKECKKVLNSYGNYKGDIIIQEFISSDCAGVVFSNAGDNKMVINATLGLCEPVVGGKSCDEYIVDRTQKDIIFEQIEKKKPIIFYQDNQFKEEYTDTRALTNESIHRVMEQALRIESFFKFPQDIEFCFRGEDLFILQSRPVTKTIFQKGEWKFYDSANIAESYSGMVLPLTISFAKAMYSQVYRDLLVGSGVSRKKVDRYTVLFDSLTTSFYGRMYYNMNSWYRMMTFLPGYKRNKNNLELMISSNTHADIHREIKPSVFLTATYPFIVIAKLIAWPITVFLFKRNIKRKLHQYRKTSIESYDIEGCKREFQNLIHGPLRKWYITVENDTVLMTLLGRIHTQYSNNLTTERLTSRSVSADQVVELQELAIRLMGDSSIASTIVAKNKELFLELLERNSVLKDLYEQYFLIYGGRFANELKLESTDIENDFDKLCDLFILYSKTPKIQSVKKISAGLLLTLIRYFATNRESTRLLRSNMFSVVRRIFSRIGVVLYQKGYIEYPKDVFYLNVDEILNSNTKMYISFSKLILDRKTEYMEYKSMDLPSHFSARGDSQYPLFSIHTISKEKILHGSTSSSGIIRGKIRVFKEFAVPDPIDFDILVAKHTDPGWVPLIGLSKGLIIEHGGILSHASIVSRELGIPAIIGVKNAIDILKTGDIVLLDGSQGKITIEQSI